MKKKHYIILLIVGLVLSNVLLIMNNQIKRGERIYQTISELDAYLPSMSKSLGNIADEEELGKYQFYLGRMVGKLRLYEEYEIGVLNPGVFYFYFSETGQDLTEYTLDPKENEKKLKRSKQRLDYLIQDLDYIQDTLDIEEGRQTFLDYMRVERVLSDSDSDLVETIRKRYKERGIAP